MLILTRRVGETVMIGNEVTVTVLGVKGNQVRIGVNAPKDVAVHREEIYERIKREEDHDGQLARSGRESRRRRLKEALRSPTALPRLLHTGIIPRSLIRANCPDPERWPSGRRRAPAKGVWVKSPSRVRIPPSPPIGLKSLRVRSVLKWRRSWVG